MENQKHPLWQNLFRPQGERVNEVTSMWMETPLFEKIPVKICRELVKEMHPRQ